MNSRYSRNILLEEVGIEGQKRLSQSRVLVCGAGGLGSGVLANLAGLGVKNIGLVDYDVVEASNLNRQFVHKHSNIGRLKVESAKKWVEEYNPDISVEIFNTKLDKKNCDTIIADYDIIADCFDSFESKILLNEIAVKNNKTLVHAGVSGFRGQVFTIKPYKTACLKCLFPELDKTQTFDKGVVSPAVNTIAALQSSEIFKQILNVGEKLEEKILFYDVLTQQFKILKTSRNKDCELCRD